MKNKLNNRNYREYIQMVENSKELNQEAKISVLRYIECRERLEGLLEDRDSCDIGSLIELIIEYCRYSVVDYIPRDILRDMIAREAFRFDTYVTVANCWINPLVEWINGRRCLEIMSGKGRLASVLKEKGVDIIATDSYYWSKQIDFKHTRMHVEKIDANSAIEKYGREVEIIIMSWCYMDEFGYEALLKMREVNPNAIMIYIGETKGGCTGSDSLYCEMNEVDIEIADRLTSLYPRWRGLHERIYIIK